MKKIIFIGVIALLLGGCSSWVLKEQCNNTNWFEYSQNLGFQGKYLEEDAFIKSCKGVDKISAEKIDVGFKLGREKMCQYSEIFNRGKEGIPVYFNFCDGLSPMIMKGEFQKGLKLFCTHETGYSFGKSGKVYQKVCSSEQEKAFLPTYYKGRKEYLVARSLSLKEEAADLKSQHSTLVLRENSFSREFSSLPNLLDCSNRSVYNEATKKNENRRVCEEPSHITNQRNRISNELSDVRRSLALAESKVNKNFEDQKLNQKELDILPVNSPLTTVP